MLTRFVYRIQNNPKVRCYENIPVIYFICKVITKGGDFGMFKKITSILLVFVLSLIGVLSLGTDKASADYRTGYQKFKTEDGLWDGRITTSSADRNVRVYVRYLYQTDGYGATHALPGDLLFRLCNEATNVCTAYKDIDDYGVNYATFTGMKIGTFKLDIKDTFSGLYVYGERDILAY